jgi:hypothetical protein
MSKRNIIIGGIAVVIGLAAIGAAAGGAEADPTDAVAPTNAPVAAVDATAEPAAETPEAEVTEEPAAEAPEGAAPVAIGGAVQIDDNLTVTVTDVKSAKSVGEFQKPAGGR